MKGQGDAGKSCQVLSAGGDRTLRVFHTAREAQSREMSQGHKAKKARTLEVKEKIIIIIIEFK